MSKLRIWLVAAALAVAAGAGIVPAGAPLLAQGAPIPAVLEEIKPVTADEGQAAYMVRFSPKEPRIDPLNTNPTKPAIIIRNALRAPRVAPALTGKGLVRAAQFEIAGQDLVLRFDTSAPARVTVEPAGQNVLQIKVRKVSEEEAVGSRPVGSEGASVAPASDLAPQMTLRPGESFELIPLKYADVSEVIGLLVEGATIEPNNVFIRREPGFGSLGSSNQPQYLQMQNQQQPAARQLGQSYGNGLGVDRRLNAIWVAGSPERIAQVKAMIALIDVPVDSVILETQFVELTESGAKNLGIDLNNSNGQIAVGKVETGTFLPFSIDPNDVLPSGVIAGVDYVAANGQPGDVANMSLGGGVSQALDDAVVAASGGGVRFALAAGNESDNANNHSPARANGPNVFTVSAFANGNTWASFSNYGNPPIDYAEPGVSIKSTWLSGGYNTISGTSMATPHLAGILLARATPATDGVVSGDPAAPADPIGTR